MLLFMCLCFINGLTILYTQCILYEQIHLTFSFNLILDEEECLYYCSTYSYMSNILLKNDLLLFILIFHNLLFVY